MDNHREYVHERINPDIEQDYDRLIDSLAIIESPSSEDARQRNDQMLSNDEAEPVKPLPMTQASNIDHQDPSMSISTQSKHLVGLPFELVDYILSFLGPIDLVAVSSTCKFFAAHAKSELAWQRHVQDNIPGVSLTSPYPCKTYRELYISHDPHWFLPKYKVWFCDYFLTGKLIITRYDPRKGSIEGFRLVAERPNPTFVPWEYDDQVLIHEFEPQCRLHMDQPVLQLDAVSQESLMDASEQTSAAQRFRAEIPMRITERSHRGVFSNFILTRPVEERPSNMQLWPPSIVPARHRVHNASQEALVTAGHKPQTRSQVSNQAFRIRRWIEMPSGSSSPGLHLGEEVCTYATLDPKLYTPTEDKPYRGIWVGDYSGHGCEFLLMHQPDDEVPFDEASVVQAEDESVEEWSVRKKEERTYRGSLEAIKLTGDPNVPRGEYTFISDDISKAGFIRTATEERFKGARIVKSRGHIAARMFRNDKYIESQLIMISHDRLAQYWAGFGHISFYHRVNIDDFLSPSHDPPLAPIAV
ncbi:F-box domain-containing protein [Marssonina coronariae]|uniref:F-box domain-containing protein n=1 Tax=Diplocarpon coronariae TaxID=2795749 RepID=A0A218Z7W9_9HELO|nr:F-box domain-containing protein [Marssonina coronariae]